jgi:hypothetical protein
LKEEGVMDNKSKQDVKDLQDRQAVKDVKLQDRQEAKDVKLQDRGDKHARDRQDREKK